MFLYSRCRILTACVSGRDADRSGNCPAGLLVDEEITNPNYEDFYLQSHAGLLGSAFHSPSASGIHYGLTHASLCSEPAQPLRHPPQRGGHVQGEVNPLFLLREARLIRILHLALRPSRSTCAIPTQVRLARSRSRPQFTVSMPPRCSFAPLTDRCCCTQMPTYVHAALSLLPSRLVLSRLVPSRAMCMLTNSWSFPPTENMLAARIPLRGRCGAERHRVERDRGGRRPVQPRALEAACAPGGQRPSAPLLLPVGLPRICASLRRFPLVPFAVPRRPL